MCNVVSLGVVGQNLQAAKVMDERIYSRVFESVSAVTSFMQHTDVVLSLTECPYSQIVARIPLCLYQTFCCSLAYGGVFWKSASMYSLKTI
jgi:hypothetical protein